MCFNGTWKLIDFEGLSEAGALHALSKLNWTPIYMSPEFAAHFARGGAARAIRRGSTVMVSRLMDVWSVGMVALEAVILQPVLQDTYDEYRDETESNTKFFDWLSDMSAPPIIEGEVRDILDSMDKEMSLLLQGMLRKDPAHRFCIAECFVHSWFAPIRNEIWKDLSREVLGSKGKSRVANVRSTSKGSRGSRSDPYKFLGRLKEGTSASGHQKTCGLM
eukprot:gnl/TRDRNA2_/TRDRNA2_144126_c0_seq1.p1 gnl/TRDRNA2_/TRDRNA2_144126_c0~~gnl/TRDRNA2_/TRDRNA2_144126_c0_seq1.p1  ORF type:complete len:254 (+),score=29.76 gnl/TRDRNA2_/TRDRNA2_144126_c0_seq1:108-764(+)